MFSFDVFICNIIKNRECWSFRERSILFTMQFSSLADLSTATLTLHLNYSVLVLRKLLFFNLRSLPYKFLCDTLERGCHSIPTNLITSLFCVVYLVST